MTDRHYLTPSLKKYYLLDFEQVLLIDDPFWGIPETFLKSVLTGINSSENFQTLYSKIKHKNDAEDDESYLVFTYAKKVEHEIHINLQKFSSLFQNQVLTIEPMPPSDNLNVGPSNFQIGAIHNKNYFNIYHYRITFVSKIYNEHLLFWETIRDYLINI